MGFVGVGRQHGIYLSSPTRDWTSTPALEVWSLNHWTTREVPLSLGFFLTFYFVLGYSQLTKNIVIVSAEQWRDSAIQIHISILPQTPLPSRLPHNIEQNSMYFIVGPCWLSILNILIYYSLFWLFFYQGDLNSSHEYITWLFLVLSFITINNLIKLFLQSFNLNILWF